MSDEQDNDTVEIKAHVPSWARAALSRYLPLILAFFVGNGTAGAALYKAPSSEEIAEAVRKSVASELEPIRSQLKEIEKRQTDLESVYSMHSARMAALERRQPAKLSTRNR